MELIAEKERRIQLLEEEELREKKLKMEVAEQRRLAEREKRRVQAELRLQEMDRCRNEKLSKWQQEKRITSDLLKSKPMY